MHAPCTQYHLHHTSGPTLDICFPSPHIRNKLLPSGAGKGACYLFSLPPPAAVCECSFAHSCLTLCDPMDCKPARLLCPWDSPGRKTRVGCHFLFQGIFPTQGSNPHLLHWQHILYHGATWEAAGAAVKALPEFLIRPLVISID